MKYNDNANQNMIRSVWLYIFLIFLFSCEKKDKLIDVVDLSCADASENWDITSSAYPNEFNQNDIYFSSKEIGYSVGQAGSIMKTEDGGETWNVIHDRNFSNRITELKLTKVCFISNDIGFIGGERKDFGYGDELLKGAILLKTINGGIDWTKKYFENIQEFDDLFFFDQLNGVALASIDNDSFNLSKKILLTNDGGESWQQTTLFGIFINSNELEVTKHAIFVLAKTINNTSILAISFDKGLNWTIKPLPEGECNRIIFINDQVGFLTCGLLFFPETVYKTEDQGGSWRVIDNNPVNYYSIVHFVSEQQGIVINNVYKLINSGGETVEVLDSFSISETFDGGNNWSKKMVDYSCGFDGPSYDFDSETFCILGNEFCLFELK